MLDISYFIGYNICITYKIRRCKMLNIRVLRTNRHITQVELAKILGITQATLSDWENNKIAPKAERLPEIAKVLKCSVDDLFSSDADT